MNDIINYIFGGKNQSFFYKKKIQDENINKIKNIFQRWFPNKFEYNYYKGGDVYFFYILYKRKMYKYYIDLQKNKIKLKCIYIIYNLKYYKEIIYKKTCGIEYINIIKVVKIHNHILSLSIKPNKHKQINNSIFIIFKNSCITTKIYLIENYYRCIKYIYNDEYIYIHKSVYNDNLKYSMIYRLFKLFI